MCAATPGHDTGKGKKEKSGLVPGHAYTLIGGKEIKYKGKNLRLIQMRNPWRYGEWKGRFGDKSDEMKDPKFLKLLDYKPKVGDGIFWMSYEDMRKFFVQIDICKIDDRNVYSYI